jgi:hypothetical protein
MLTTNTKFNRNPFNIFDDITCGQTYITSPTRVHFANFVQRTHLR